MFEIVPPRSGVSKKTIEIKSERIINAINSHKEIDAVNIPEVVDENYRGLPYYRNIDNLEFGKVIHKATGRTIYVDKGVSYLPSKQAFAEWLEKASKTSGVGGFVFVGGGSSRNVYQGPSVLEANSIAKQKGPRIGNICIPGRRNEVEKLVLKTQSGCSFFTTQILLEPAAVKHLLKSYYNECSNRDLKPADFFLSLTPVSKKKDIEYLWWLGVEISKDHEHRLLNDGGSGRASVDISNELWLDVRDFLQLEGIKLNVHPNVEMLSTHNLELACRMIETLG